MSEVTQLLDAAATGDRKAAAELLPLVYEELRKLAAVRLVTEPSGHTLQPTALVHEAYLRLVGDQQFDNRGHFFAAAAEAMRRILVDHARSKGRHKRGGDLIRHEFDAADQVPAPEIREDLVALDEALTKLESTDSQAVQLVQLRYFAGLSIPEAARALGISARTADRLWAFARVWLLRELAGDAPDAPTS
jgi:RNA polymerase sigma factor (TIGR02999 family)